MPSAIELARGDEKLIAAIHRSRRQDRKSVV